jgi:hypothetical protein
VKKTHAPARSKVSTAKAKAAAAAAASADEKTDTQGYFASLLSPAGGEVSYAQVALRLPRAHMRVLDTESRLYGLRRSQFLEFLLLNQKGQRVLVRMPSAPRYEFARAELTENERFLWVLRPQVKKAFEEHILPMGLRPSAWAITALNDWAGLTETRK